MTMSNTQSTMSIKYGAWIAILALLTISIIPARVAAQSQDSCPPCTNAEAILKPCNTSLQMEHWPGTFVYQPTDVQAPCACNQNYFDQMRACLTCQSSSSAKLSVKPLDMYQLVCTSFGQKWEQIYIPNKPTTTTSSSATSSSTPNNGLNTGGSTSSHSNLSSGAVAGIIVSAIALVVALSVAGYVYVRRKRELARQQEEEDVYKYQDNGRNSYIEAPLPQYTGMIQPTLPALPQLTNLRVMNPDYDEDDTRNLTEDKFNQGYKDAPPAFSGSGGFEVNRNQSPGWRRGSFDDD